MQRASLCPLGENPRTCFPPFGSGMSVPQNPTSATSKANGKVCGVQGRRTPGCVRSRHRGAPAPREEQAASAHSQVPCPVTLPAFLRSLAGSASTPAGDPTLRALRTSATPPLSSQEPGALPGRSNSRAPLETNAAAFRFVAAQRFREPEP